MDYHLLPHVSFGFVDDRAVALDLRTDRYFMIAAAETSALRSAGIEGTGLVDGVGIGALVRRRLIGTGTGPAIAPVVAEPLSRSALEVEANGRRIGWPEIAFVRAQASLCLRFLGLQKTLARWQRLRLRYQNRKPPNDVEQAALQYAQGFADGRLLLPAKTLCVPDSLTLACILWRRGIDADVYFGVRLAPFLAHAWVQRGDMLLSDTLNTVGEYTPVFRL
ncbi:lasso peptide biosynthesis B2 protein [Sphingopyxis sp. SE2]|uniref:lasso peptide biosynthesis B2 protein n=1 Tax=Sphingopyxis sp. SE2 TaxID=1586240 RepID=UPI0028C0F712|nr:lasso peptide biosynthesis B2 protein [Sphingopyxis sp. SE2]MDT7529072.1 lasso peptide biosynthesis B2 protein [Sphingopyxis sp. SE2]